MLEVTQISTAKYPQACITTYSWLQEKGNSSLQILHVGYI